MNLRRFSVLIIVGLAFSCLSSPLFSQDTIIVFKKGDTLYRIAREYNIPIDILKRINNISDPSKVREGLKLRIPYVYTVKKGDTLYSICRENGITPEDLTLYNPGLNKKVLKSGDKIVLLNKAKNTKPVNFESGEKDILWPHSGAREPLAGKLDGIAITGAPGDQIISVSDGRVIWAGPYRGFGKMVLIESRDRYIFGYAGNDRILVDVGKDVKVKTPIAILGESAHDGKAKAYFFIYRDGKAQNPLVILRDNY
jgi:murein DD-endopeptidase MepM/ murein hydrolase activator NlpD